MQGQCLCGAVTITAPDNHQLEACHCGMCRRWGGGPLLVVHGGKSVDMQGSDKVTAYKSSEWGERAFCRQCGTHLFYRLIPTNDHFLPVGLFPDQSGFQFKQQIFTDNKPSYYEFANQTEMLTEAEALAKFTQGMS
jgi:hypothetical protein